MKGILKESSEGRERAEEMRGGVEERECGEIREGDQQGVVDGMIIPVSSPLLGDR